VLSAIRAIEASRCSATTNGFSWVRTLTPPITAWTGMPASSTTAMVRARNGTPRSAHRVAQTRVTTMIAARTNVSSRFPNSITPWMPYSGWLT